MASSGSDKNMNGIEDLELEGLSDVETSTTSNVASKEAPRASLTNGKSEPKVLFSGDIVIKAQLDDDIRCTDYNNQELTFIDLLKLLERMFKEAVKATDDLIIKYKDMDGDYVTMEDDHDVGFAIRTCGGLNLRILRSKKQEESKALASPSRVRAELLEIRNRVDSLLSQIDNDGEERVVPKQSNDVESQPLTVTTDPKSAAVVASQQQSVTTNNALPTGPGYMTFDNADFDPLSGVSTSGNRRGDVMPSSAGSSSAPPPVATSAENVAPIKQVIDSFQPTARDTLAPAAGISSNHTIHRPDQPHDQPQPSSQQSQQHTSSLFNRGGGAKPAAPSPYQPPPTVQPPAQQHYQPAAPSPNAQQPSMPPSSMYGAAPVATNQYATSSPYQYQAQPSFSSAPNAYGNVPNPTPTTVSTQWGDTSATYQPRSYPQMNTSVGPGQSNSALPGSPAPPQYGTTSQQPPAHNMYGQMGGAQPVQSFGVPPAPSSMGTAQAPPSMGPGQVPPPMGGGQVPPPMGGGQVPPPMGNAYRPPGGPAPPPPTGAAGGSANPYSRMGMGARWSSGRPSMGISSILKRRVDNNQNTDSEFDE